MSRILIQIDKLQEYLRENWDVGIIIFKWAGTNQAGAVALKWNNNV